VVKYQFKAGRADVFVAAPDTELAEIFVQTRTVHPHLAGIPESVIRRPRTQARQG